MTRWLDSSFYVVTFGILCIVQTSALRCYYGPLPPDGKQTNITECPKEPKSVGRRDGKLITLDRCLVATGCPESVARFPVFRGCSYQGACSEMKERKVDGSEDRCETCDDTCATDLCNSAFPQHSLVYTWLFRQAFVVIAVVVTMNENLFLLEV